MTSHTNTTTQMPFVYEDLVWERQHTLRQEAEAHRLAGRVMSVRRARRQVDRAPRRLQRALARA